MNIIPGRGVALVEVGESRAEVEARIGEPVHGPGRSKAVYRTDPTLVICYLPDDTVELVELGHGAGTRTEVHLDGVQLTWRFLDEVVAELTALGHTGTETDIGHAFHAGFAIWSMGSRQATDLDPEADEDDERAVVEGVSVAPYAYFTDR
ncbi:hypothetical protein [Embleya scabrispora]|uniref:hypothetical protein n=1 Tax=Embleya scabrispora TaxID=159449 RepID=UPI00039E056F|nr:hypothetical protein [Embleya scabrispora]MYS87450.1 hypothetical protein [Streptomyces sp. SID5474]